MTSIALLEPVWRVAWIYAQPSIFDKLFLRKETPPLHGRFPNWEFFWSAFSRIRTEYRYLFFTLTSTDGKYRQKNRFRAISTQESWESNKEYTTWKVSVFGVFLVCFSPHFDWLQRDTMNSCLPTEMMIFDMLSSAHFTLMFHFYTHWKGQQKSLVF